MILQPFPSESDQLFQLPITEANNNMAGVQYNFVVVLLRRVLEEDMEP